MFTSFSRTSKSSTSTVCCAQPLKIPNKENKTSQRRISQPPCMLITQSSRIGSNFKVSKAAKRMRRWRPAAYFSSLHHLSTIVEDEEPAQSAVGDESLKNTRSRQSLPPDIRLAHHCQSLQPSSLLPVKNEEVG